LIADSEQNQWCQRDSLLWPPLAHWIGVEHCFAWPGMGSKLAGQFVVLRNYCKRALAYSTQYFALVNLSKMLRAVMMMLV
jgi:hypothetical protein